MIKGLCFICVALIELLLFDLPSNVGDVVWVTLAITDTRVLWGPRHKRSLVLINLFLKKGLIWSYASNLQDLMGVLTIHLTIEILELSQIDCQCIILQCCSFWFVLLNLVGDLGLVGVGGFWRRSLNFVK